METLGLVCLYGITSLDDIKTKHVQLLEIIAFGLLGIIYNIVYKPHSVASLLGGVAIGLFVMVFSVLSKEKIGKGDAYIIMVTGLYLGFMDTALLLWISSVMAFLAGIVIIRKYDNREMEIPFVPFLLLGYLFMFAVENLRGVLL